MRSFLRRLLASAAPAQVIYYCTVCDVHYNPSDPADTWAHLDHMK
ncbi:hypothetical protein ABZ234_31810 [Nocardiopsis sp. NPDC006198]